MKMNTLKTFWSAMACVSALAVLGALCGCDSDDPGDYDPPVGSGAIVIDNNTYNDISVFINGEKLNETDAGEDEAYDLAPGLYRVVLDEQDGDHSFSGDVDVLEDRVTVLDVTIDTDPNDFDVGIFFD